MVGIVAFVGLGNMGVPMSGHLADAGWQVRAFDIDPAARARTADRNATVHVTETLEAATQEVDAVILMLPDSKIVNRVVLGDAPDHSDGVIAMLPRGKTIIDMSSSEPTETIKLSARLSCRGLKLIDAPVSGGVAKAETARLTIMAGGDEADVDIVAPMLETMGRVFRTGQLGSGHASKALNNFLSASSLIATAEAIIIGQRFGLDPAKLNDVFKHSTGRSNTTDVKVDNYFIPEDYSSGFALDLLDKDVGMARDLAASVGMDAEMLATVTKILRDGRGSLADDADHTAMHAYIKAKAPLT